MTKPERSSVLVLDDDPEVRETMSAILEAQFDVTTCFTALHALDVLRGRRRYHVVVTDWKMPGMDGIEFFRRVQELPLPVSCLLVSGHIEELLTQVDPETRRTLRVLAKPIDPQRLLDTVAHLAVFATLKESSSKLQAATQNEPE